MAVEVAQLVARLRMESAQFQSQLAKVEGEMRKAGTTSTGMGGLVKKAGMASVAALVTVGVASVHMADQFELAHAQMTQAITNSGGAFNTYKGQISSTEKHLEDLGFSHTEVENALTTMITSTHNTGKSLGLMSLAADLAARKNMSLADAAGVLAKVNAGNVRILKMMGLDLPVAAGGAVKLQTAQASLAKATERLKELQTRLGVSVAASSKQVYVQAKGTAALQNAQMSLHKTQDRLANVEASLAGKVSLTTAENLRFQNASNAVTYAQQRLALAQGKVVAGHYKMVGSGKMTVAQMQQLHNAEEAVAAAQKKVNDTSKAGATIFTFLGQVLHGSAAARAKTFAGELKTLHARVTDLMIAIGQKLIPIIVAVVGWFMKHKMVVAVLVGILLTLMAISIVAWFASLVAAAYTFVAAAAEMILYGLQTVIMFIALNASIFAIIAIFVIVGLAIYEAIKHWRGLWTAVKAVWDAIKGAVLAAFHFIRDHLVLIASIILGPFGGAIAWIATHWSQTWHFVQKVTGGVVATVITLMRQMLDIALNVVGGILHALQTAAHWLSFGLADPLKGATQAFDNFHKSIDDSMTGFANDAMSWGTNVGKNMAKGIASQTNAVGAAAKSAAGAVSGPLRIRSPAKEGPLSEGGPQVWGAKLISSYAVGMNSALEQIRGASGGVAAAAMPAAAPPGAGGGGGGTNVTVIVQGSVRTEQELIEAIRRGLYKDRRHNATTRLG